jgi:hypothetical protein
VTRPRVVARVMSSGGWSSTWHTRLRPTSSASYQVEVEVEAQPRKGCALWAPATSRRVTVAVR